VSQIWNRLILTAEGPNRVVNAYAAITYKAPLSVSFLGPTSLPAYSYGSWAAAGTGGTPPYSYTWYKDGYAVATGADYSDYVGSGGLQLQVNVTDAVGTTATGWLWVSAENQCGVQFCVEQPMY
jgi:hypothetical protein